MAALQPGLPTLLNTPGPAIPGAYPLSRTSSQSHAEQSSVLAAAKEYFPAEDDLQQGLTNAGQAVKAYLPSAVAGYLPTSEPEAGIAAPLNASEADGETTVPMISASSSAHSAGNSNASPQDGGHAQLGSTSSLVPSCVSDTANSDSTAHSISSSLASSKYDATAPPNSPASSNSPKFLSSGPALGSSIAPPSTPIPPVAAEYFAHPEVQKSHIDGARIPVAGQPGSISAASYSTPQGNILLPTASARTTSSPPSIFSVKGTSVAVNSTTTQREKSAKAAPSNEVLATLAAEGVARYFEAEGLSGAGPFVTTPNMTPPALDWEQRSIFTGNENTTPPPNGHTDAKDAQRAEFSDAHYGVLGREEAASGMNLPQTNTSTVAGENGTGSAVFTAYGVHPTALNLGTQATGVSDDIAANGRTEPKDSTPKTEKRRSRLVAKIREKMHVG